MILLHFNHISKESHSSTQRRLTEMVCLYYKQVYETTQMCFIESSVSEAGWKRRAQLESSTLRWPDCSQFLPSDPSLRRHGGWRAAPPLLSPRWRSHPSICLFLKLLNQTCHKSWCSQLAADGKVWTQLLFSFSLVGGTFCFAVNAN